jgi:hypothetical protein
MYINNIRKGETLKEKQMNNSKKSSKRRRVTFASIELTIDFASMEDAIEYKRANQGKGWLFMEPYLLHGGDEFEASMTVRRPYKGYTPGW